MNTNNQHCCVIMAENLLNDCIPIRYLAIFREYSFVMLYANRVDPITYCPWCKKKLPSSLRDNYFVTLKQEYYFEDEEIAIPMITSDNDSLPKEFLSDQWWIKRGL